MNRENKEITSLVNKIVKARKIQKARIEDCNQSLYESEKRIQKINKPVVDVITKTTQDTLKALNYNQQQNLQAIENIKEQRMLEEKKSRQWVQAFYVGYRSKKAITKMEVSTNGELGTWGKVDIPLLFNDNVVRITIPNKQVPLKISKDQTTEGLIGLLLLPYDDLRHAEKRGVEIKAEDMFLYADIMVKCGTHDSKNSKKYQVFVKAHELNLGMSSDPDSRVMSQLEAAKVRSEEKRVEQRAKLVSKNRIGMGVIAYNDPVELDHRLDILLGSIRAGNNSKEVKDDVRAILDRLLQIDYIPQAIHQKFYQKFKL